MSNPGLLVARGVGPGARLLRGVGGFMHPRRLARPARVQGECWWRVVLEESWRCRKTWKRAGGSGKPNRSGRIQAVVLGVRGGDICVGGAQVYPEDNNGLTNLINLSSSSTSKLIVLTFLYLRSTGFLNSIKIDFSL